MTTIGRTLARLAAPPIATIVLQAVPFGAAGAVELDYRATLGAGHSDNIARTETNEQTEDIGAAGLQFSLYQASPKLTADLFADLAYYDYRDNTFDSEFLGSAVADARYAFVPGRFEWSLTDNFGQVLRDPFSPSTPTNRENINYLETGPDVLFAFGEQMRLRLAGRYALTTYEESPLDSDTVSGMASLMRLLSSSSSVGLNVRTAKIEYDEAALNADYKQNEAYLSYEAQGARTRLAVDAGYTEIDREAATRKEHGALFRIDITRRVSPSSTASLNAGREFQNSASAFGGEQAIGGIGLGSVPGRQTPQPFQNDHVTLGWDYTRDRTGLALFGRWEDRTYDGFPLLAQTMTTYGANLRRTLSQTASLMLGAAQTRGEFAVAGTDYNETAATAAFSWQLTRSLSITATYNYVDRNSDLAGASYTENRYWLTFGFGRGDPRNARMPPQFAVDTNR